MALALASPLVAVAEACRRYPGLPVLLPVVCVWSRSFIESTDGTEVRYARAVTREVVSRQRLLDVIAHK